MSKLLLTVMALLEVGTGAALLFAPSLVVESLLGEPLSSSQSVVLGQITGAALISIGLACWLVSDSGQSEQKQLLRSMLLYNAAVPAILIYATIRLNLQGPGLVPGVILHMLLALSCFSALRWQSGIPT